MTLRLTSLVLALSALSLAACGEPKPAAATSATASAEARQGAAPAASFDLSGVPVSTVQLAASPYFAPPAGYRSEETGVIPGTTFPIWLGGSFQMVQGDVHWMRWGAEPGKTLSREDVAGATDAMVTAAGGVKIVSGQISETAYRGLTEAKRTELLSAFGDVTNSPTTTYVIRRADKTIWVHSVVSIEVAYLSVIDAPPFVPPTS